MEELFSLEEIKRLKKILHDELDELYQSRPEVKDESSSEQRRHNIFGFMIVVVFSLLSVIISQEIWEAYHSDIFTLILNYVAQVTIVSAFLVYMYKTYYTNTGFDSQNESENEFNEDRKKWFMTLIEKQITAYHLSSNPFKLRNVIIGITNKLRMMDAGTEENIGFKIESIILSQFRRID